MAMDSTPELKMVEMVVSRIVIRDAARGQHIYLRERDGSRGFTLVIGSWEAEEIRRVVAHEESPRPMTHQLALSIVHALGGRVVRCDIVDFREHTFFGQLAVETLDRKTLALIDSRPSDGIAIALRAGAQLRCAEFVLEQVRSDASGPDPLPEPAPEPTPEPAPEPTPEPAPEPTPEPTRDETGEAGEPRTGGVEGLGEHDEEPPTGEGPPEEFD